MVLSRKWAATALSIPLILSWAGVASPAAPRATADGPPAGEVVLPLGDYLALVEAAERAERAAAEAKARSEAPAAAVTAEKVAVVFGEDEGTAETLLEVRFEGIPKDPVRLPLTGLAESVEVEPAAGASVAAAPDGSGLLLVASRPGTYKILVRSRAAFADGGGVRRFALAPVIAAVASTELDLPADLAWASPGAVVVEDRVEGGRRKVRLASRRGQERSVELRRKLAGSEAEKLLAQAVVLTLVQLRPEGPRRHDVVLYEVSRGSLASFTVDLPAGLAVEQVGTEEGGVVPVVDGGRLTAQRRRQLQGVGYLVLSSSLAAGEPEVEVRARYLAVASSVAGDAEPLPAGGWTRVDLSDLPAALSQALEAMELSAAWRLAGPATGLGIAVRPLPAAPTLAGLVRLRETTSLATGEGTVLHRDRLTVEPPSRPTPEGVVVELELPPGATLWSATVAGLPVRPLEQGGKVSIPLGAESDRATVVEVISVVERAIPPGRGRLALELPRIATPVLEHRWRLLLPERAEYRYRAGELAPAVELDRAPWMEGAVAVGAVGGFAAAPPPAISESAAESAMAGRNAPKPASPRDDRLGRGKDQNLREGLRDAFKQEADELRQGLVGGVKPLPVSIPEEGKSLLLTGVLPPARVTAELDVKAARR
jgi:hypothetical protein